jgi:hypothetical protein
MFLRVRVKLCSDEMLKPKKLIKTVEVCSNKIAT